ncbi:hypothetical protein Lalb_Chr13g0292191 [Lupinus albus]|uniref:Uncharacterized protein n=1 Tax=Lupinus albus TaxID=3870 RepID=A0A6A4PHL3_LUPAL|nr:hypothetical protein Lalb_Chr13g0292191 [Lupinus albus]
MPWINISSKIVNLYYIIPNDILHFASTLISLKRNRANICKVDSPQYPSLCFVSIYLMFTDTTFNLA